MYQITLIISISIFVTTSLGCGETSARQIQNQNTHSAFESETSPIMGKVTSVVNEITLDVDIGGEISRFTYIGVAAPGNENNADPIIRGKALAFNKSKVDDKIIQIEKDSVNNDESGNILGYIFVDGEMLNIIMLKKGYVIVSGFPTEFKYKKEFLEAEKHARSNQIGYWSISQDKETTANTNYESTDSEQPFFGGTLPVIESDSEEECDYSGTPEPVIKGNVDKQTGEQIYLVPDNLFYSTTKVNSEDGDIWICTEQEAIANGWVKSKH